MGIAEVVPFDHVTYTNSNGLWGSNADESNMALELDFAAIRR